MAIIGQVERRNWKVRVLSLSIHILLILGSATMIYPLLLMLSGSVKSNVDFSNFSIVPQYVSQDLELFRKYVTTKYNNSAAQAFIFYKEPRTTTNTVTAPVRVDPVQMADYAGFLAQIRKEKPHYWRSMAMTYEAGVDALTLRKYREWLQTLPQFGKGEKGLARYNEICGTKAVGWNELFLNSEYFLPRRASVEYEGPAQELILQFKNEVCTDDVSTFWPDAEGVFIDSLRHDVAQSLAELNRKLKTNYNSWSEVSLPATVPENPYLATQWLTYVKEKLNPAFIVIDTKKASPAWRNFLLKKYGSFENICNVFGGGMVWKKIDDIEIDSRIPRTGTLRTDWLNFISRNSGITNSWSDFIKTKYHTPAKLNEAWGVNYKSFNEIPKFDEFAPLPADFPEQAKKDVEELCGVVAGRAKLEVPNDALRVETLALSYRDYLLKKYGSVDAVDQAYSNGVKDFSEVKLTADMPGETNLQASHDWQEFVRSLTPEEITLTRQSATDYKKWLSEAYKGDYEAMSRDYGMTIQSLNTTPSFQAYPVEVKYSDKTRQDYVAVIKSGKVNHFFSIGEPAKFQQKWQEFLSAKYKTPEALNQAWHFVHADLAGITLPSKEYDWHVMEVNRSKLIKEYLVRNYLMVFDTLIVNGNAALNTLIYCFLAVLAALIVNPLCAYGLSRYKPAASYKILLFLLLPMAFPGMVLGIPQFLLVKDFGLLNTFACLILPGMAQGYSIFLLKGFFDSLPKELFESAAIDGANEWIVFWNIGMSLSKPILAVIALGAFTGAYANFMLAFLMCQKQSMWTMMVYLYQLQQRASAAVGFAALVVAAIPTLLVFIFCQNIIIRGIVVPTEK